MCAGDLDICAGDLDICAGTYAHKAPGILVKLKQLHCQIISWFVMRK